RSSDLAVRTRQRRVIWLRRGEARRHSCGTAPDFHRCSPGWTGHASAGTRCRRGFSIAVHDVDDRTMAPFRDHVKYCVACSSGPWRAGPAGATVAGCYNRGGVRIHVRVPGTGRSRGRKGMPVQRESGGIAAVIERFRTDPRFASCITAWRTIPERPAETVPLPEDLEPRLAEALRARGIQQLYSHQAEAFASVRQGRHTAVVTGTASGKTLCYTLPVLDAILRDPTARALYLFPTKALAQDQYANLHSLIEAAGADIKTHTYDGDTPANIRRLIRTAGHVVITNPDMLHSGILPHHTKWHNLFENLRFVVIDEMHGYRGVFGSHVANVIRRLKRICQHYGSSPVFILASATIAYPEELARRLIEEDVHVIDRDGAPHGRREFAFFNPPVVNQQLGIRRSVVLEATRIASEL